MEDLPQNNDVKIAVIMTELSNIKVTLGKIENALVIQASNFVTKEQLAPIRMIVYGMVGIILTSFLGGIAVLVLK